MGLGLSGIAKAPVSHGGPRVGRGLSSSRATSRHSYLEHCTSVRGDKPRHPIRRAGYLARGEHGLIQERLRQLARKAKDID